MINLCRLREGKGLWLSQDCCLRVKKLRLAGRGVPKPILIMQWKIAGDAEFVV